MGFRYPVTLDLEGRRCVVVGGGALAEEKVRGLLDAGARVAVVSAAPSDGIGNLAGAGRLELVAREYAAGDLDGAFLAIAATGDPALNARIHAEAQTRRVLLNAVDDRSHCDFATPAIVRRGDLAIAVSTGGKAPALARRIQEQLSAEFGPEWGELVDALAEARSAAGERTVDFATWAQRWSRALDEDLLGLVVAGRREEAVGAVRKALAGEAPAGEAPAGEAPGGRVAIVGAGPGDPGLITVRGKALIEAADVVVYDRLVNRVLWAGKPAIDAGKEAGGHRVDQEEINALLVSLARQGKAVVRLKGGDPFVFGRGAEEADALRAAGVPYEVVPAPTSAIAALDAAGIPVTDRRVASSVAIVTGHCVGDEVDWAGLARSADTLVVLMGLGRLGEIAERLIGAGRSPGTPAAVVASGTLPEQQVVRSSLGGLAASVAAAGVRSPAVIVVGEVVGLAPGR
jgi:uroporphyrin-III C-methyltransferase/precorrin-2 dehydrogenase/sirohydrochlorin ferrochelatase